MFAPISVQLIDHMGSDLSVANAARVSMAKESEWEVLCDGACFECDCNGQQTRLSDRDAKLIGYLAKHNHWTPFSHPQLSFRISAPIFVARQWFKHVAGITRNETSRRYVDEAPTFYLPEVVRARPHTPANVLDVLLISKAGVARLLRLDRKTGELLHGLEKV